MGRCVGISPIPVAFGKQARTVISRSTDLRLRRIDAGVTPDVNKACETASARRVVPPKGAQGGRHEQWTRPAREGGGGAASTCQVTSLVPSSRVDKAQGSRTCRSPHAPVEQRSSSAGRVTVLWLRRPRPRRRGGFRCRHDLVLRNQRTCRPRLRPPLARRTESRRHHRDRLDRRGTRGHSLRRVPLPGRFDRREDGRPRPRHPLRPLGAHGHRDRRASTRVGHHRKRPRAALRPSDSREPGRRRR